VVAVGDGIRGYLRSLLGEGHMWVDYRVRWRWLGGQGRWNVRTVVYCVSQGGSWMGLSQRMYGGALSVINRE
jgi:hypothetical protein